MEPADESSYMLRDKKRPSRRSCRIASPDEDWSWYVVGGCAFANFLLPGMLGSFGPDVLDRFAEIYELESKNGSVTRWISTTFDLTFSVAGSLSCLLCELTSHRAVTFWGGLLASAGMMCSSFADSTFFLYISYGVMVGFGAGLCCPAGMLMVNEYFDDERRGLANGLSLVGTAVGSLALPPYVRFLTTSYGCRGGILIVSGMLLNVLACALTYKPTDERSRLTAACSNTSINGRATDPDEYYAAVVSSSSAAFEDGGGGARGNATAVRRRLFGGDRSAARFLAVSASNAVGHFGYAAFAATVAGPWRAAAPLQLAAADAAGRLIAPAVSDMLSSRGTASVYLNAVAMAVGGAALLFAAARVDPSAPHQKPWPPYAVPLVAFALASGAAAGLEPLVAVRVLGRRRLAASCSVTLLGKGAAQLAADLLFSPSAAIALYALGSCLLAAAAVWTVALPCRRYRDAAYGRSRYVRTV